jgi:phage repressor protein C with HTH and peptisase S24 domain
MQQTEQQAEKVIPAGSARDTGGRIKQLLEHYKLTTYQANEKLGYQKSSKLYKVLGNEVRPGYDTLVEIMTAFPEVSADWLLTGAGSMLRGFADDVAPKSAVLQQQVRGGKVAVVTVDEKGRENTVLVPIPAQAGYTTSHNEAVYLQQLSNYRVPGFDRGEYRAFEVAGDSMEPTINHRDVVICTRVEELRLLEPGEIYVVVTSESVMLKRIKKQLRTHEKEVTLYSDNSHRHPYVLETRDILELWRVRGYISNYIPSAPDVTVERLWEVIEALGFDKGEVRRHLEESAPNAAPSH